MSKSDELKALAVETTQGKMTRRDFLRRAAMLGVTGIAASAWLAACSPAPTAAPQPTQAAAAPTAVPPTAAPKSFKLGLEGPFTGPSARVGEEFKDAATMAFNSVNWVVGDTKFELVTIDDESDAEKGSKAYEAAITQDKIGAAIMNWHSFVSVAQMEIAAKYKIPQFFGFGATGDINTKYKSDPAKYSYWMGKTWPTPIKLQSAYVEIVESAIAKGLWKPAQKVAAVYGNDTDWCREFAKGVGDLLKSKGWTIADQEFVPVGETDFLPLLTKLKAANAPLIAGTMSDTSGFTSFIKQTKEAGINSLIVADGLGWVGEWYTLTGPASDGVLDQIPQWTTDKAKKFAADFKTQWGSAPSASSAGLAYDMTNMFIALAGATFKKYGAITSETLYNFGQTELWTGNFSYKDGILMEEYKYTADTIPDPVVGEHYFIFPVIQYSGGNGSIVWPDAWAQGKLQPPAA